MRPAWPLGAVVLLLAGCIDLEGNATAPVCEVDCPVVAADEPTDGPLAVVPMANSSTSSAPLIPSATETASASDTASPSSTDTASSAPSRPPRADEVEVRDVRVETTANRATISWTVWPAEPDPPISVGWAGEGAPLANCFCPTQPRLVDGRYVSQVATLAGGTDFQFKLTSALASPSEDGWGTTYRPVVLHQGTFTTSHATLAVLDVHAAITGTSIWFWANTTGDGKLTPVFRWTDENGTTSSTGSAGTTVQGRLSQGLYGSAFGPGPYTVRLDLQNDRGEQVSSPNVPVERR